MRCTITRDRELVEIDEFIGYAGENRAEKIKFDIPEELQDYKVTINFGTKDGCFIDNLEGNIYVIKNNLTKYKKVDFYLEFTKELEDSKGEIIKTSVLQLNFKDSFSAEENLNAESLGVLRDIEKRLAKLEETGGSVGADGKSAYDIWLENGNTGTKEDFINSLRGADGENGVDGYTPQVGKDYNTETEKAAFKAELEQYCKQIIKELTTPAYIDPVITFSKNGDTVASNTNSTSISVTGDYEDGSIKYAICENADGSDAVWIDYTGGEIEISGYNKEVYVYATVTGKSGNVITTNTEAFNMVITPSITSSSSCTITPKRDFSTMKVNANAISCSIFVSNADIISRIEYSFTFGDEGSNWQELSKSNWKITDNKITGEISRNIAIADFPEETYPVHLAVRVTDNRGNITNAEPEVSDITIRR